MTSTTHDTLVDIQSFGMKYGKIEVVKDLSFNIARGELFGFLGANGSGKTTTIRALLNIITPTKGTLTIGGKRFTPAMTSMVGYLPEERGLYQKETTLNTLVYFAILKGVKRQEAEKRAMAYLERAGLVDKAHTRTGKLSGGQQQKIQLGITILHEPSLMILDEPTKGLDPVNRTLLMEIINERRAQGAAILLVSHDMDDVERLCDRILLLKDGRREFYGTVNDVKSQYGKELIAVKYDGAVKKNDSLYTISALQPHYAELVPHQNVTPQAILHALAEQKDLQLYNFNVQRQSLNDIFVSIYTREGKHHA